MEGHRRFVALIPAAGGSRRYADAGYVGNKSLLQVRYRGVECTMIEHVIRTVPHVVDHVLVGARPEEDYLRLYDVCTAFPVERTIGQADTLLQMATYVTFQDWMQDSDCGALVLNCDALIPRHLQRTLIDRTHAAQASVLVCDVKFPNWSYADDPANPTRFVEKPRPVDGWRWGMAGAWAFASLRELRSALQTVVDRAREERISTGEVYLSAALNEIPGHKQAIVTDLSSIVDWNTPDALVASGAEVLL